MRTKSIFSFAPLYACVAVLLCVSLQAQQKTEGSYRISGTVMNAATGEPLSRAGVSIALPNESSVVQSTQTGPDGHFVFGHLPAAKYALTGSRLGFITAAYDEHEQYSTAIVTGAGFASENLVLRLVPDAVISGVVAEDSGDPVENARVSVYRQTHDSGVEKIQVMNSTNTDDSGAYEFPGIAPGNYFIVVIARPWYADNGASMIAPSNASESTKEIQHSPLDLVYATTFYADVTNSEDATPIPVKGGERIRLNFVLHPQPALHLLIHSPVSDDPRRGGMQFPPLAIAQQIFGTSEFIPINQRGISQGLAEISVAPGEYQLQSRGPNGPNERLVTLNVNSDQTIDAGAGELMTNITGKLAMASGEALPDKNVLVYLTLSGSQNQGGANVTPKGEFELANVPPGKYRLNGSINGKPLFVAKLAATGAEMEDDRIVVGSNPVMLAATVYADPELEITGFAKKDGKPAPGAMIVLVPQDPANNRDLFRRDQSDSDGSFSLRDVIPGKYKVVAIEDGWTLNWAEPNVIAHYLARGQSVTVDERNSKITALKDAVEAQPK